MIGISSIMGIGLKVIANREKIAAMWDQLVPVVREVSKLYPQLKNLIDEVAPGVTEPEQPPPNEKETMSVSWLQESLNTLGADPELVVDGRYGEATKDAVAQYQEEHPPLVSDGWAGAATQASIYEELKKHG